MRRSSRGRRNGTGDFLVKYGWHSWAGGRHIFIDISPRTGYKRQISLTEGAFRKACRKDESKLRCLRAEVAAPHSGGFGSPVDRHKDRSARSVLNRGSLAKRAKQPSVKPRETRFWS